MTEEIERAEDERLTFLFGECFKSSSAHVAIQHSDMGWLLSKTKKALRLEKSGLEKAVEKTLTQCYPCQDNWPVDNAGWHQEPGTDRTIGCKFFALKKALTSFQEPGE